MSDEREQKDQVKEMIVERLFLTIPPEEIGDEEDLRDRFDLDSIKTFEIVIGLEEVFGISFEGDDDFSLENFTSVQAILKVMNERAADPSAGEGSPPEAHTNGTPGGDAPNG